MKPDNSCATCGGLGYEAFPDSDGGIYKEPCFYCNGKGYFDEADYKEAI